MSCELQALFNYFSCSAVAIATLVGGSNATMVTALMIAAHMVSTLFLCSVLPVTGSIAMGRFTADLTCLSNPAFAVRTSTCDQFISMFVTLRHIFNARPTMRAVTGASCCGPVGTHL